MTNPKDRIMCPIANSIAVIEDTWSWLILRDAHDGLTRFEQFRKSLDIAPTMLTKRLKTLVEADLLQKIQYSAHPPRDEYVLTEAGQDFLSVLFALGAWGRKHRPSLQTSPSNKFIDKENGTEIIPVVIDSVTGAKIGTRPIIKQDS